MANYTADVQTSLNKSSKFHIKGLKVDQEENKVKNLVNKASHAERYAEVAQEVEQAMTSYARSVVSDTLKKNVAFHHKLGLAPKIVRKLGARTGKKRSHSQCDFCRERVGTFEYNKDTIDKDIFRRHAKCNCTLTYYPGDGKRQDAWFKVWSDVDRDGKIEERKSVDNSSLPMSNTRKLCLSQNITYNPVTLTKGNKSENTIIKELAGGDLTKGSCASLALAYVGKKAGYDVLDFRGGDSCGVFCRGTTVREIANLSGVNGYIENHTNDFKAVKTLLAHVQDGKEYILATGGHAAIIRGKKDVVEYLELQSPETKGYAKNGFSLLDNNVLKKRFGCKQTHTALRRRYKASSILIDAKTLYTNNEFKTLLGFINTPVENQMKGNLGNVK